MQVLRLSVPRLTICAAALLLSACSISRPVTNDYDKYLSNNQGEHVFARASTAKQYYLPATTQNHLYEFRSATVGYANVWKVEFGQVLDATMRSRDIVNALGNLDKASAATADSNKTLVFELQSYTFADYGAHINLTIILKNNGAETFKKTYQADGKTQGGKMFWAGAFGMKNAVQQSTKLALDSIMDRFIQDISALPAAPLAQAQ